VTPSVKSHAVGHCPAAAERNVRAPIRDWGEFFDRSKGRWQLEPAVKHLPLSCLALAALVRTEPVWPQSSGLGQRVPNTTLGKMPSIPATFGYTTVAAFPGLVFDQAVGIATPPGETNRLFIVEKTGRIQVITNLANPTKTLFLDISARVHSAGESGLLGLAFHPGYATNRFFYVFYSLDAVTAQGSGLHQRVSCFETSATNPNQAAADFELPLITQFDEAESHNGGCLQFGPDGYLYISVGDGGLQYDRSGNSQRIDKDFFSAIMRIDVDKRAGNPLPNPHPANSANYAIPADNPYIGLTSFNGVPVDPANIRTEFYAIGLRNPWRFWFDPVTGWLYCGDVGQDTWEEVDVVVKGGNYGWAYREGLHPGYKTGAPVGQSLIDPIQDYQHGNAVDQGYCVIGGAVYRGEAISQLAGAYIFADYVSGHIWALRYDGTNATSFQSLTDRGSIVTFGADPRNGDVLLVSVGVIYRLIYDTNNVTSGGPLPLTLADTGAFSDLTSLTPNAGIVPYDINVPFWSDHAQKTRWFSVPDTNLTIGFNAEGNWSFPTGTVWIKHFDLELTNGVAESRKRLETRFIVRNSGGVYGVTYRWGDSTTNATLVAEEGMDEAFVIDDGGTMRTQVWHYPSRAECLSCHTLAGGLALGFNTPQMNRDMDHGGGPENQIAALGRAGYFSGPVTNVSWLRALAHPTNTAYSVEYRVHSYLTANCSQCHQPGGTGLGFWDARITTPMSQAGIINGALSNNRGDADNRVVAPGSLEHSMMFGRVSTRGPGQMPPLDSNVGDTDAADLLGGWIMNELPSYQNFAEWQIANFGSTNAPEAASDGDPDNDGANNLLEYLTGTDPMLYGDAWKITVRQTGDRVEISYPQIANRGFQVEWAPGLGSTGSWQPLDVPANRPFFAATDFIATIADTITNTPFRFYRVRVFEP
jgi:glucose/arabinose dehydrogenase